MARRYHNGMIPDKSSGHATLPESSIIKNWPGVGSANGRMVDDLFSGVQSDQKSEISKLNRIEKKGGR